MKALKKRSLIMRNMMKYAISELRILKYSKGCKFIVGLEYAFQTPNFLYLVLEYCP